MKPKSNGFSERYATALEKQLKRGPSASLEPALQLGREAVALKLETLDLARIHEKALADMGLPEAKNGFLKLAGIFFAEANSLIEETHRPAQQGRTNLNRMQTTLDRRTEELAASNRELQRGVARHKVAEDTAQKKGRNYKKSLDESLQLQKLLRKLTHRVMLAQEDERKNISRELQDEIAQTLLGINVRLLSLKQHARNNTQGFKDEIASTQELVLRSAQSVRRVAREIGYQPEPPNGVLKTL